MKHSHASSRLASASARALAILGEALIINRITGSHDSRVRLIALTDMAYAAAIVSANERQTVIGGAK